MIKAYAASNPESELEMFEYDPGVLGSDDVELDVLYAGICHSDLSMIDNKWGISQYPLVPGHEIIGRISKVGRNVEHLTVGQVVGLGFHAGYCHACESCNSGDHNLCSKAQSTIMGRHGGFADKVRADGRSVVVIPDGIDLGTAGPLFCAGITVFNPLIQYDIKPTARVAVIGIGGLGHLALQFLNAWGCEVTAFTSSASKKQEALSLGAHHTLNSRDTNEIAAAAHSFDLIISTVDVNLDWNLYIQTLKSRGRLHFVGAVNEPLNIELLGLMAGQRSLSSSTVGSPVTMAKMLNFAQVHNIKPVVEMFYFDEINKAIKSLREGDVRYRIVLQHRTD